MTEEIKIAPPPAAILSQQIWGFATSQAIYAACKLRVFEAVHSAPKTCQEIAQIVGAHEPTLRRLLRALTSFGLLNEDEQGYFNITETGDLLRYDHPQSLAAFVNMILSSFVWKPYDGPQCQDSPLSNLR